MRSDRAAANDRDAAARAVVAGIEAARGPGRGLLTWLYEPGDAPYEGLDALLSTVADVVGRAQRVGAVEIKGDRIRVIEGGRAAVDLTLGMGEIRGTARGERIDSLTDLDAVLGPPRPAHDSAEAVTRRRRAVAWTLLDAVVADSAGPAGGDVRERSILPFVVARALAGGVASADPEATRRRIADALGAWRIGSSPTLPPELRARPSLGRATAEALAALARGDADGASPESTGSGPLTWSAPLGCVADWSVREAFEAARVAAGITHRATVVRNAAAVVAAIVRMLVAGRGRLESVAAARHLVEGREDLGRGVVRSLLLQVVWQPLDPGRFAVPVDPGAERVLAAALAEFVAPDRVRDPVEAVERMRARPGEGRTAAVLLAQFYGAHGIRLGDPSSAGAAPGTVAESADSIARRLAGSGDDRCGDGRGIRGADEREDRA